MNKELEKINVEIRSRREVLDRLDETIKIRNSEKDKLDSEIKKTKAELMSYREERSIHDKLHSDRLVELRNAKSLVNEEKSKHLQYVKSFEESKKKIDEYSNRLSEQENMLKKEADAQKAERVRLERISKSLVNKEIVLNEQSISLDLKARELETNKKALKESLNNYELKKKSFIDFEKKIEEKFKELGLQKKDLLTEKQKLLDFENSLHKLNEEYNENTLELHKKNKAVEDKSATLDAERLAHRRHINDFKNSENQLKIRELRVLKIIRDKKVSNELRILEEQEKRVSK